MTYFPSGLTASNHTPNNTNERASVGHASALIAVRDGTLPQRFPIHLWTQQSQRYDRYYQWYDGLVLDDTLNRTSESGQPILVYPLQMNPVRNFVDKHAAVALGEADDTSRPIIASVVIPYRPLDGSDPDEAEKQLADVVGRALQEVWMGSDGSAIQQEVMKLAQALGGGVLKASWQPWRKDLRIPIVIEKVLPDHFLPVYNPRNYNDLFEVFEVYRIPGVVAREKYNVVTEMPWVIYYEHWTKRHYSIYVNGKPVTATVNGRTVTYDKRPNPWGEVPYVYLPAIRDGGSFYGRSLVPQIEGLAKELNARMADNGDAVRDTVHRKRYIRNTHQTIEEKRIASGIYAIDLGNEPPTAKNPPDVFTEDPPKISDAFMNFGNDVLWQTMLRFGDLQNIAFGEDEGSQRSALTLAFRMWPTTTRARQTRIAWDSGLNWFNRLLVTMMIAKKGVLRRVFGHYDLPEDAVQRLLFSQDWHAMIPRDREQDLNEIVLRVQAGLMSPETALSRFGDVRDIPAELDLIRQWLVFKAELGADDDDDTDDKGVGSGVDTTSDEPSVDARSEEE